MKNKLLHTIALMFTVLFSVSGSEWDSVSVIVSRIHEPVFPDTIFYATEYGAIGDSSTLCTEAFQNAIDACSACGGGKVVIRGGIYITGPLQLKSDVNLYINKDAKIIFSSDISLYDTLVYTRFQGIEFMSYCPLIYAFEQENIAITGSGILDGLGNDWYEWVATSRSDFETLEQWADNNTPVEQRIFTGGSKLRPSMIQPYRCSNVFIDSITVKDGPFWHVHPVLCNNVKITNISVAGHGYNNDGCNPESCKDVLIRNCFFDTGDDCIALKSGRNTDGRRVNVPTEKVVIQNCTMKDGHGGVVIGSESTGGVRYVFAEDCFMDSPNLWYILRIKTNSYRGSHVNHIYVRNIEAQTVGNYVLRINYYYGEGTSGGFQPDVNNIYLENVNVTTGVDNPIRIECYNDNPARYIFFKNCHFKAKSTSSVLSNVQYLCIDSSTVNGMPLLYKAHDETTLQAESYATARNYSLSNHELPRSGYGYMESMRDSSFIEWQTDSSIFTGNRIYLLYHNTNADSLTFNFTVDNNSYKLRFAPTVISDWDTLMLQLNNIQNIFKLQLSSDGTGTGFFLDRILLENPFVSDNTSEIEEDILIYPSPAKDIIFLSGLRNNEHFIVKIYNLAGQCIKAIPMYPENNFLQQISISSFKPGTYIIKILSKSGEITNKKLNII